MKKPVGKLTHFLDLIKVFLLYYYLDELNAFYDITTELQDWPKNI